MRKSNSYSYLNLSKISSLWTSTRSSVCLYDALSCQFHSLNISTNQFVTSATSAVCRCPHIHLQTTCPLVIISDFVWYLSTRIMVMLEPDLPYFWATLYVNYWSPRSPGDSVWFQRPRWGGAQDHGLHSSSARSAGPRPQHPPLSLRSRRRSHRAGSGDACAVLHHTQGGIQTRTAKAVPDMRTDRWVGYGREREGERSIDIS